MRICGMDIEVSESNPGDWARDAQGRSNSTTGKITIRPDLSHSMRQATLLHEVIHQICDANQLGIANDEVTVAVLGCSLHAWMRDNPQIVMEIVL